MEILSMVGQFILCITIIVGLHELGHLATAKWFGMRVEKYYIGFPPRVFSFKRGETEYGIGAIPLGGFVKIAGMVDESMDTEALKEEPKPYEFRAKPAWQRLIVMLGGIIVNIITGILTFIVWYYNTGDSYTPVKEVNKQGIAAYTLAQEIGLRSGDKLLNVNGEKITYLEEALGAKVFLGSNVYYTVERDGKEMRINIPNDLVERLEKSRFFISPFYKLRVNVVNTGSAAEASGMKVGDKIVSFNGKDINYYHDLEPEMQKNKGKKVPLVLERDGKRINTTAQLGTDGKLGFGFKLDNKIERFVKYPSVGQAISGGTTRAFGTVFQNIQGMKKVTSGEVSLDAISGPLGMYRIFPPDWSLFWINIAMLSMWLAFINFLPIPALDGGHALFLTIEIVSGRKIPEKFLEYAQMVGMVLLLGLMVFILGLDIWKIVKGIILYFS